MTPAAPRGDAPPAVFWRVFPWDPEAAPGEPFSPQYVVPPERQTRGRFDLGTTPVLYLAESPPHAVAEMLRPFTGRRLHGGQLRGAGHRLALVRAELRAEVAAQVEDLTDPAVLLRRGVRSDALASRDRAVTQGIARALHDAGLAGFRWWSALHGDWHAVLLFMDRVRPVELVYDRPEPLSATHPAVLSAARALGMVSAA